MHGAGRLQCQPSARGGISGRLADDKNEPESDVDSDEGDADVDEADLDADGSDADGAGADNSKTADGD